MSDQLPPSEPSVSVPPEPVPRRRSAFYRTFVGPYGVRAGWKVVLFFLIFSLLSLCFLPLAKLGGKPARGAPLPPGIALLSEFLSTIAVLLATFLMARFIDRKPWGYFGMPLRNAFRSTFWIGAAVGLGALALQLEIMHLGGWFDFGTMQLQGFAIVKYGAIWALMFLCVGFTEEGLLRGYVQRVTTDGFRRLPGGWSFWASALLFSIVFGAGHLGNPGENKFGIIMVFIDGMSMCFSLWRTGDLWWAIGNHAAWDWGQTFLFGTPNSGFHGANALMHPSFHGPLLLAGGADGPEGSVLVLLSEAIFVLSIAVIYRRRKYPMPSHADAANRLEPIEGGRALPLDEETRGLEGATESSE
jgi:membrane protease YdiL (CAAX protease family)